MHKNVKLCSQHGFTLIELSIVLVIIGLIVGGILVGQDLIKAAEVRAQISQIEKFNSAVNTFRGKFQAIPGDMSLSVANQFGFTTGSFCNGIVGARDGNGLIDGFSTAPYAQAMGETGLFWQDISSPIAGNLIETQVPNGGAVNVICNSAPVLSTTLGSTYLGDYLPVAKINGNFIYVYETGGYNWFGIVAANSISAIGLLSSNQTIPVIEAYKIDLKVDDGIPTSGTVLANYVAGVGTIQNSLYATPDSNITCFHNLVGGTFAPGYSISSLANYGAGGNCALSFRFQ